MKNQSLHLNNTFAPLFPFAFFHHTRSAKCKVSKERGTWQWTCRSSDRNIFDRDETTREGAKKSWFKKRRWKRKRWRRWEVRRIYMEYELRLLNFIIVCGAHHVSRHTFTSNSLQLGGEKKVKQVFLTSCILLATKLLFREYFEELTPPCNNLLSCYSEEETLV